MHIWNWMWFCFVMQVWVNTNWSMMIPKLVVFLHRNVAFLRCETTRQDRHRWPEGTKVQRCRSFLKVPFILTSFLHLHLDVTANDGYSSSSNFPKANFAQGIILQSRLSKTNSCDSCGIASAMASPAPCVRCSELFRGGPLHEFFAAVAWNQFGSSAECSINKLTSWGS